MRKNSKKKAFTLVEIMIAVGIVILLSALSIHSLLQAKITANETAAIRNLRTLQAAMEGFRTMNGYYPCEDPKGVYSSGRLDLLVEATPPYLDTSWTPEDKRQNSRFRAIKNGYRFELKFVNYGQEYLILAEPENDYTGTRRFELAQMQGYSPEITSGGVGLGSAATPN